jgi:exodeoxyribonuclease-3
MRIITLNVNGIRSAAAKGVFPWLARQRADVICLQEVRALPAQIEAPEFHLKGYTRLLYPAERPGYAGVALYARREPERVVRGFGVAEFDREGRYLEAHFGAVAVVSLYLPSGSAGPERQASKNRFLDAFVPHLARLRAARRQYVLCGDWNIAHKAIDLKNWKGNQRNSGFLPEERAWMDRLFGELGFVDSFRTVDARPEQYTWWSNRGQAWANNVGWRIDYQVATPELGETTHAARIFRDRRFSDHAPLIMDYGL